MRLSCSLAQGALVFACPLEPAGLLVLVVQARCSASGRRLTGRLCLWLPFRQVFVWLPVRPCVRPWTRTARSVSPRSQRQALPQPQGLCSGAPRPAHRVRPADTVRQCNRVERAHTHQRLHRGHGAPSALWQPASALGAGSLSSHQAQAGRGRPRRHGRPPPPPAPAPARPRGRGRPRPLRRLRPRPRAPRRPGRGRRARLR